MLPCAVAHVATLLAANAIRRVAIPPLTSHQASLQLRSEPSAAGPSLASVHARIQTAFGMASMMPADAASDGDSREVEPPVSVPFDDLPSVSAYFEAGHDERIDPLLRAIGRLVRTASSAFA